MSQQTNTKLQDKFQRVQKPQTKKEEIVQNEIRITSTGKTRSYITYATTVLGEKKFESVILKAMGRAINKAVTISEIIRRRVADIHQITEISSHEIVDEWEPKEQGLQKMSTKRNVSSITIVLSTKALDTKNVGYQKPLPTDQVVQEEKKEIKEKKEPVKREAPVKKEFVKKEPKEVKTEEGSQDSGSRGRGRGGRGRARGRGRGRGGRGTSTRGQSEQ